MPEIYWPQFCLGLIFCLFGWALYWAVLHLAGGAVGAGLGLAAAWLVIALLEPVEPRWEIIGLGGAALLGFILGVFLMRGLHRFFFFLLGSLLGLALGRALYEYLVDRGNLAADGTLLWQALIVLVAAVAFGLAMVFGSRLVVMACTAVWGALLAALAVQDELALLAVPPVALASLFFQTGILRRLAPESRDEEEDGD